MKKTLLLTCLTSVALLLAACAPASSGSGFGPGSTSSGGGFSGSRSLTDEEKLAIGTIKLDTTEQKIGSAEAQKLLPLWQLLHQLHSSSAAAPQEIAAVVGQIRSTMTPGQVASMDGMQITRADIAAVFQQEQAGSSQANSGAGASRPQNFTGGNNSRRNGSGSEGQFFFFGGPDGGALRANPGTANGSGSTTGSQTIDSAQRAQAATNGIMNALINQVIALLQNKLSS